MSSDEQLNMASESTWLVDVTRSSNDVKGIVQYLARVGMKEDNPFHLVVYAAMEGVDGPCVNTLWQKFRKMKTEKEAQVAVSEIIASMRMHVDSEVQWEDGLLRLLATTKPAKVFAVMPSTTRRALLKGQDSVVLSPQVLEAACQVNILCPSRPQGNIKAEVVDLHHLVCGFRSLTQLNGQNALKQFSIPENAAAKSNYFSTRRMSKQISDPAARNFSRRLFKDSEASVVSPRFMPNFSEHTQRGSNPASVWPRSSWLSSLRPPKDSGKGSKGLNQVEVAAPSLGEVGRLHTDHSDKKLPRSRSGRRRIVACSGPLLAPCPPSLPDMKSASPGKPLPKSADDMDVIKSQQQIQELEDSEAGSRPSSRNGWADTEESGHGPRLLRPNRRKLQVVPQSTPLGAAAEQAHRDILQRSEKSPACMHDQVSQSSDETSRSRDISPRSHTESACSWGSPWTPPAPTTPVLQRSYSKCREFSSEDLMKATSSFSDNNLLGKGTSGTVHKGCLAGCPVVVKKLPVTGAEAGIKFQSAVSLLSRVRHPNLVLLVGHCTTENAVIYEFMDGGTIGEKIKTSKGGASFKWYDRIRVASEVASTLLFLHSQSPSIIHGDLRPENIFLDSMQRSKLCDVGLAPLLDRQDDTDEHWVNSKALRYVDPRELLTGDITKISDIYAFGLVFLQLILGETDIRVIHRSLQFINRAYPREIPKQAVTLLDLVDKSGGAWPAAIAEAAITLALECTSPDCRPSLQERIQPELQSLLDKIQAEQRRRKADLQQKLICPLSKTPLVDPVIAADGLTYERKHMEAWLENNDTSPVTGIPLPHKFLSPNLAVQNFM